MTSCDQNQRELFHGLYHSTKSVLRTVLPRPKRFVPTHWRPLNKVRAVLPEVVNLIESGSLRLDEIYKRRNACPERAVIGIHARLSAFAAQPRFDKCNPTARYLEYMFQ